MAATKEIPSVLEFDGISKKTITRPMTEEEYADYQAQQAATAAQEAEADAKAAARASALAKLADLGLTADEIAAL